MACSVTSHYLSRLTKFSVRKSIGIMSAKDFVRALKLFSTELAIVDKQDKSEGFDSCDRPSNIKLDSNH